MNRFKNPKTTRLVLAATLAATVLTGGGFADSLELNLVNREVLQARLLAGEVGQKQRQSRITQLFSQAGCSATFEKIDKSAANVVCTLPGQSTATIVVGAHFDFADRGAGIVDDWSGAAMLASLYDTLKAKHLEHTFEFVAFAEEERGLIGSTRFVKELSQEQKDATKAFINLECLGVSSPKVWVHRSTPFLVERLADIANAARIPVQAVNVERVGDDDTHPFLSQHIPVISIHSLTQQTWPILHSNRDQIGAVRLPDYFDAYRLVAFYLNYLDGKLPR